MKGQPNNTRRQFLREALAAGLALPCARFRGSLAPTPSAGGTGSRPIFPNPARGWRGESSVAAALRAHPSLSLTIDPAAAPRTVAAAAEPLRSLAARFPDLRRHFVFEYYPWYATDPYRHWDEAGHVPPSDIAASSVPLLGPYDSRSRAVLERHARWIADTRVGAVNLSWWGPGGFEDRGAPIIMDVFRDHDIKVTFHLEPYDDRRGERYAEDVLYLLREFGEKRRFDCLLLLQNEDGSSGPVFKSFRSILPREIVDCHGIRRLVSDYTSDEEWLRQTTTLRQALRHDFDHVTLLADSLDHPRTQAAGFDGIAIYDNFVPPSSYAGHAEAASRAGLLFSFNVNPGFDAVEPRHIDPDSCYAPPPFAPPFPALDWSRPGHREQAAALSEERIRESLEATLRAQSDPAFSNFRRGFFLVYVNSFNEWHEGHAFEPMKDFADLTLEERIFDYHNPRDGSYRLSTLRARLREALGSPAAAPLLMRA